jgi:excisionase family DNA binding protein
MNREFRMAKKMSFPKSFWLTIKGVERLLGWHRSRIRRSMKKGELPFVRDHNRYARFPRTEIEQFAQELGRIVHGASGKVAARAFALFAEGKTWQEVLIILGREMPHLAQPVEVVRRLHAQFLDQDKRPASTTMEHGEPRSGPPAIEDPNDPMPEPVLDADEWRRQQEKEARRAQAAHEREERNWQEDQRRRAEQSAQRAPSLGKAPPRIEDKPAHISERFALLVQMLAAKKASE